MRAAIGAKMVLLASFSSIASAYTPANAESTLQGCIMHKVNDKLMYQDLGKDPMPLVETLLDSSVSEA